MGTFAVAAAGFAPAQLEAHPAHERVLRLPDPTDPNFYDHGRAMLADQDPEVPLLVVHAERREHARRVGVLRAMSRSHQVVGVGCSVPPTGLAARATWLSTLAERRLSAGLAIAHLRSDGGVLPTVVVVTSVSGLAVPGVSLGQHVLSWVPGIRFGLVFDDQVRVETRRIPEFSLPAEDHQSVSQGDPELWQRVAGAAPTSTWRMPDVSAATQWWGRAGYFEQTFVPQDPVDAIRRTSQERFGRCPECGGIASGACPFCSAREEIAS